MSSVRIFIVAMKTIHFIHDSRMRTFLKGRILADSKSKSRSCALIDSIELHDAVRAAYSNAALQPAEMHPFPVGREFAESVGYPAELLNAFPLAAGAFAGVSNVSVFAEIRPGATVLDLGCGAGLDALIASRRTGPRGSVLALDFSDAMLERARQAAIASSARSIEFLSCDAAQIPLPNASVDVAMVNGIFNLNPERDAIFGELARVVRPGGAAWIAELILSESLPEDVRANPANWFA